MSAFANVTAACGFGSPERPRQFNVISSGWLRQVRRDVAVRGKAVVALVSLRHRQRDAVPGLHVQSLRQRPHQASPAPETFGLIDIAGVGVTNVLSYQARAVAAGKLRLVLQDY
jgi:hypothetical protein